VKFVEALQALPLEVVADKPLVQAAIGEYGPVLKLIVCNERINFLLGKRFGTLQILFGDAIDVGGLNVAVQLQRQKTVVQFLCVRLIDRDGQQIISQGG
jgi:hypothetical protein